MYDVLIVGAGPSGLYSSIVLKRGIPTQNVEEDIKVGILEKGIVGGLTRYAHIQISKHWSFSGSNLINNFYQEARKLNVDLYTRTKVEKIENKKGYFEIETNASNFKAKYIILANGILSSPESLKLEKVIIGLHNAKQMLEDIRDKGWKNIILYGNYTESLQKLRTDLLTLDNNLKIKIVIEPQNRFEEGFGNLCVSKDFVDFYDGILIDYNSYKLRNGSTDKIEIKSLNKDLGFIYTNSFCETNIKGLYAVGTSSNVITGIPICLSTAQIASLDIGRKLNKIIKTEPSGRFPWFPRENNWNDSWLNILKEKDEI
ncbi:MULTISPECIES: NAD(P)/FAD-dependent oxidoreductase [Staphylococcus]|uniref:NAD(P)/FAD-dependent oxidoreductase n=1 Tax=Staphylococcus equorum TaxID=246432 RepID=A0AAW7AHY5_9STAP|nr:NAD(P)/FAD-dependent oxidoreductase [Staphylococcus equorum]MDK9865260.1 NAD(P)/FAD-dependent oxidoreductase [Staphylococcus equorum]